MKKQISFLFLALLFALAFFLRFWRINANPPALNWDEVSHGYNAYSILKTGRDEWGRPWPLIFRAYGDYKLPLYIYLTVLPVKILGLNALAVRLVSALAGLGLVWLTYLLARLLWKEKIWALLAAFLLALSPWNLFVSRMAAEANLAAFLLALGVWLFLKKYLGLAILVLGLAMEAYNAARVVIPLLFAFWLIGWLRRKDWRKILGLSSLMLLVMAPLIWQFINRTGQARFFWTTPLDQGAINRIEAQRQASSYPPLLSRLFHNRPLYFMEYLLRHYPPHFGINFLFLQGGSNYQFSLPGHGLLAIVLAPFFFLGIYLFFVRRRWFWLFWLLVAFLPSAMTRDAPHVLRSLLVLPLPLLLAVAGLRATKNWLRVHSQLGGNLLLLTVLAGVSLQFFFWWRDYWRLYRPNYAWAWQYGYKEAVRYVKRNYGNYDEIIFSKKYGEPHEFVLFYWPWEPSYYQHDVHKKWDYHAHWYWVDGFDKFKFWNDWEVKKKLASERLKGKKILLVTSPNNWLRGGHKLTTINSLDGQPIFEIIEY